MQSALEEKNDGMIGFSVLVLMTAALVASQAHGGPDASARPTADTVAPAPVVAIDRLPPATADERPALERARGAIRQLRVLPSGLADHPDFRWSPTESLVKEYCGPGC